MDLIILIIFFLFAFIAVYPFWYTLVCSFSSADKLTGANWLVPVGFTAKSYQVVLEDSMFWRSLLNTVVRVLSVTLLQTSVISIVAYAMSHPKLPCKRVFQSLNLFTMFFSGGIIPYFYVINLIGLYDTFWVYILPASYSVYNMIVVQNYFKGIPAELRESAELDGAGQLRIMAQIYMPLSLPVLATIVLWVSTGQWNNFMTTALYTTKKELYTLQYYLRTLILASGTDGEFSEIVSSKTVSYAAIVISTLPIIAAYPLILKKFTRGLTVGGVKG